MTKNEFVNTFVRQRKIKKTIILEFSVFVAATLFFALVTRLTGNKFDVTAAMLFSIGWFLAEIFSIAFWYFLSFQSEKEKFNNEICKDIIE